MFKTKSFSELAKERTPPHITNKCFVHCEDFIGALTKFTEVSFKRFLQLRKQWLELDGRQNNIALHTARIISLEEEERHENFKELGIHRKCYSAFTNKHQIVLKLDVKKQIKNRNFFQYLLANSVTAANPVILFQRKFRIKFSDVCNN